MRSDAPLIRYLSKAYSPKVGFYWQQLPYVEMMSEISDLLMRLETVRQLKERGSTLDHMLWGEAVFHLHPVAINLKTGDKGRSDLWARITTLDAYLSGRLRAPWITPDAGFTEQFKSAIQEMYRHGGALVVECWTRDGGGDPHGPVVMLYDKRLALPAFHISNWIWRELHSRGLLKGMSSSQVGNCLTAGAVVGIDPIDTFKRAAESTCGLGVNAVLYLSQCPEHLVEEVPEIPEGTRPRKNPDPKPWTYEYLPRVILLDPTDTPSGERNGYQGGTHASPRPHQRRGHWATLKHPKFKRTEDGKPRQVFVKPAWVGPREWIMQGNHYRVIASG